MTPERLTEIKAELERGSADEDYYTGGMVPAALGLELLAEVERLRAENDQMKAASWERLQRAAGDSMSDEEEIIECDSRLATPDESRLCDEIERLRAEVERLRAALLAQRAACGRWLEAEAASWAGDDGGVSPEVSAAVWQALTGAAAYFRGDSPPPAAPG